MVTGAMKEFSKPQYHVDIGQPQVRIEQHDVPALGGERHGQIRGHGGLADASLAACDGDHLDRTRGIEFGEGFGLLW